jgi:hypothetical protein
MKKLLALLLVSPLAFSKTINLTCEPVTMTVCIDTCETLDQARVLQNDMAPMVNANISIEKQMAGEIEFYYLDLGLGWEVGVKQANRVVLTRDGDELGEQFIGNNLTYSVDLLTKEYVYQVNKKENPYNLVFRQNHSCSNQKGLFD